LLYVESFLSLDSREPQLTICQIICTGQTPQSALLQDLSPSSIDASNFIAVRPTLQISDAGLPHVFALGDIAATKAHKAARPALKQAEVVTRNIVHLLQGEELEDYEVTDPAAIHLTLGITRSVVFRNPVSGAGEPMVMAKEDGRMDMGIDGVWARRGADVADAML
jgi:NADH dehydrogenase FAD-containing subunit